MKKIIVRSAGLLLWIAALVWFVLSFSEHLHWFNRFASMIALGTIFTLSILYIPPSMLFRIGIARYGAPNWVTLWRIPIVMFGFILVFISEGELQTLLIGFYIGVFGLALDRLDGKIATVILEKLKTQVIPENEVIEPSQRWAFFNFEELDANKQKCLVKRRVRLPEWISRLSISNNHDCSQDVIPGLIPIPIPMFIIDRDDVESVLHLHLSKIGDWLDPLVDKATVNPFLLYLAYKNQFYWGIAVLLVLVDAFGTAMRPPFINFAILSGLKDRTKEAKASFFGKTKFIWVFVTLLLIVPGVSHWLNSSEQSIMFIISSCTLGVALLIGIMSVISRLDIREEILDALHLRGWYERNKRSLEHDVTEESE